MDGKLVAPIVLVIKKKSERVAGGDGPDQPVYFFEDLMNDVAADLGINLGDNPTAVNSENGDPA